MRMLGVAAQRVGKHWPFEIAKSRIVYEEHFLMVHVVIEVDHIKAGIR